MFWRDGLHIAGYDTVAHDFDRGDGDTTYGVRLPPGALAPVLRDSAGEALDRRIPLTSRTGDLLSIATTLLADADVETRCATAVLARARVGATVAGVASELGWSTRRLHRFCRNNFGMPFATLRGLYRFRAAHDLLAGGMSPAVVAAQTGYADQSHLTREVSRFASTTPARVHDSTLASKATARLE